MLKLEASNIPKGIPAHSNKLNINEICELIHIIHVTINQNYFQYSKQTRTQNNGFVIEQVPYLNYIHDTTKRITY